MLKVDLGADVFAVSESKGNQKTLCTWIQSCVVNKYLTVLWVIHACIFVV